MPTRSHRLPLLVAVAVALVAAGAALVAASTPLAPITDPVTLRLRADSIAQRENDVAPDGFSLGDEQVRTSRVMTGGEEVGRLASICTAAGTHPNLVMCTATFKLDQGQIAVQYVSRRSAFLAGRSTAVAVVGGTGSYQNVSGQGTQTRVDKATTRFVLDLTP